MQLDTLLSVTPRQLQLKKLRARWQTKKAKYGLRNYSCMKLVEVQLHCPFLNNSLTTIVLTLLLASHSRCVITPGPSKLEKVVDPGSGPHEEMIILKILLDLSRIIILWFSLLLTRLIWGRVHKRTIKSWFSSWLGALGYQFHNFGVSWPTYNIIINIHSNLYVTPGPSKLDGIVDPCSGPRGPLPEIGVHYLVLLELSLVTYLNDLRAIHSALFDCLLFC